MQGRFFRVDGADQETGEDTYLVLQAVSIQEAETVARKQGMLVAAVRTASQADWGAGGNTTLATEEPGVVEKSAIQFERTSDHRESRITQPASESRDEDGPASTDDSPASDRDDDDARRFPTPLESKLFDEEDESAAPQSAPAAAKQSVFADAPVGEDVVLPTAPRNNTPALHTSPPVAGALHVVPKPTAARPADGFRRIRPAPAAGRTGIGSTPPGEKSDLKNEPPDLIHPIEGATTPSPQSPKAGSMIPASTKVPTPVRKPSTGTSDKIDIARSTVQSIPTPNKSPTPAARPANLGSTPTPPRPGAAPKGNPVGLKNASPPAAQPPRQVRLTPPTPPRRIPPTIHGNGAAQSAHPAPTPVRPQAQETQIVDLAPAAPESQRVSGELVGGSAMEPVAPEIDWEQGAEAVEHSSGSALEQLAWQNTASFPAQGDATVASPTELADPAAEIPVARIVSLPSSASNAPPSHARPRGPGMSPVAAYFLSPLATLAATGGILLAVPSLMNTAPADATDVARLEFRLDAITRLFLGSTVFMAGLLIFVVAALAQVMHAAKSRR